MRRPLLKQLFAASVVLGLGLAPAVFAQPRASSTRSGGLYGLRDPLGNVTVEAEVARIVRYAIGFSGALFLLYFLYGGILWLTAGGDPGKVTKARDALVNSVIGIGIVILSYTIIAFILGFTDTLTGGT